MRNHRETGIGGMYEILKIMKNKPMPKQNTIEEVIEKLRKIHRDTDCCNRESVENFIRSALLARDEQVGRIINEALDKLYKEKYSHITRDYTFVDAFKDDARKIVSAITHNKEK